MDLKGNPFYLDDDMVQWVRDTLSGMSSDEKLGQVFIQLAQPDRAYLDEKIIGKYVGGILFRQNAASVIQDTLRYVQEKSKIPVLFCGNMEEGGVGAAVKHFPGEGQDDHDQHYNCEVNEMSTSEWDACFGRIFRELIDRGTLAIMPGHIALPAYQAYFNPDTAGQIIPATYSKELLTNLLREQLGFNGLIISDNTCIAGCSAYLPRQEAIPKMLAAGIDLILYSFDMDEDVGFLKAALRDGSLSMERLDEAVTRVLAAKAALKLPEKKAAGTLVPSPEALSVVGCAEHQAWAKECADRAVTLVKDTQKFLPLTPERYPRILLTLICDPWERAHMEACTVKALQKKGFTVTVSRPDDPAPEDNSIGAWKKRYDLFLYIARQESARKDKTTLRINWTQAGNVPRFAGDIPAVYVSMGNPFDLYDVPMMKTYVNAYCGTDTVIDAVIAKLAGESPFYGTSPVDPFCRKWYLKL